MNLKMKRSEKKMTDWDEVFRSLNAVEDLLTILLNDKDCEYKNLIDVVWDDYMNAVNSIERKIRQDD